MMRITNRGAESSWGKKKKSAFGEPDKERRLSVMGGWERGRKW